MIVHARDIYSIEFLVRRDGFDRQKSLLAVFLGILRAFAPWRLVFDSRLKVAKKHEGGTEGSWSAEIYARGVPDDLIK
jgi:hypothetical protein